MVGIQPRRSSRFCRSLRTCAVTGPSSSREARVVSMANNPVGGFPTCIHNMETPA